jgi:serine/threonine protein kinase
MRSAAANTMLHMCNTLCTYTHTIGSALVAAAAAAPVLDWSEVFKDFIACCLTKDPELRWSATQLLQHPFVQATADTIRAKDGAVGSRELKGLVTR